MFLHGLVFSLLYREKVGSLVGCYVMWNSLSVNQAFHKFPGNDASLWAQELNPHQECVSPGKREEKLLEFPKYEIPHKVSLLSGGSLVFLRNIHIGGFLSTGLWCWEVGQWALDTTGHD